MTLSIEDDLGVTSTQVVDITLSSTDERIALTQSDGRITIARPADGMCDYMCSILATKLYVSDPV